MLFSFSFSIQKMKRIKIQKINKNIKNKYHLLYIIKLPTYPLSILKSTVKHNK